MYFSEYSKVNLILRRSDSTKYLTFSTVNNTFKDLSEFEKSNLKHVTKTGAATLAFKFWAWYINIYIYICKETWKDLNKII